MPQKDSGELKSPGTGPFFGQKMHPSGKGPAENMDLSPSLGALQSSCKTTEEPNAVPLRFGVCAFQIVIFPIAIMTDVPWLARSG
jgi:hypothetical protein